MRIRRGLLTQSPTALRLLSRTVVAAAICLLTVAFLAATLAKLGLWTGPVAGAAVAVGLCLGVWASRELPARRSIAWWQLWAIVALAGGFAVWAGLTWAEEVFVERDAASYFQTAIGLTRWGASPFPVDPIIASQSLLAVDGVFLDSAGFFQVGPTGDPAIEPQFLIGVTAWYSIGYWIAGGHGAWAVSALVGGMGILAVGTLLSHLLRPLAATVATAGTALAFPLLHVSRSTYSEPFGLFLLIVGLLTLTIAIDCVSERDRARWGMVAGLILGATALFRIDAPREAALAVPIGALLLIRGHAAGRPLLRGLAAGLIVGIGVWVVLSRNYVGVNLNSVRLLFVLLLAVAAMSFTLIALSSRGHRISGASARHLPTLAGATVAILLGTLLSRPWWWVARGVNEGAEIGQRRQGLPIDPTRLYYENSMEWTAWWVGWPVVLLACIASVYLAFHATRSIVRGDEPFPAWLPSFVVLLGSAVLVWTRPGINPDHPWADRRLVLLIPFVMALGAWAVEASARRLGDPRSRTLVLVLGCALVITPPALATRNLAGDRVGVGVYDATIAGCDYFKPTDVVLAVDGVASFYWTQAIRGMCDVPVLRTDYALFLPETDYDAVAEVRDAVAARLEGTGRELVLVVGQDPSALEPLLTPGGEPPQRVIDVLTTRNDTVVTVRPEDVAEVRRQLWASRTPASSG
jgi:hypothetical protein